MFRLSLILLCLCLLFGIRMYPRRWCCLRGVCFVIGFLPRITFHAVVLLTLVLKIVWVGATYKKHLPIYFYIVTASVLFGITFFRWLGVSAVLPFDLAGFFCTNSVILVGLLSQGVRYYRLFGLQQCGKYGKKETT